MFFKSDIDRQIWIPSGVVKRGSETPHGLAMPRSELGLEIELNGEFSTFEYWRVYPTWMELKILIMYIYIHICVRLAWYSIQLYIIALKSHSWD